LEWVSVIRRQVVAYAAVVVCILVATAVLASELMLRGSSEPEQTGCAAGLPAFPGAEGFGCATAGGRGGDVIAVTTLEDSGPGSFRAAMQADGRRIIVFRVSGTVELRDQVVVTNPYVTVAGQTAPGGGFTLKAADDNSSGLLDIRTHDVVVRFLRLRPGAPSSVSGENIDGLNIWKPEAHDVVIDHNSLSWAVDENASTWDDARDVTFSWNIIAQGLRESTHPDGEHSKGLLVSGGRTRNVSVHHNLFAHNTARNPQVSTDGPAQVVNNVVYNYGDSAFQTSNPRGAPHVDLVGNYFASGPDSDTDRHEVDAYPIEPSGDWSLWLEGNVGPHLTGYGEQADLVSPDDRGLLVNHPNENMPAVTTTSAQQALTDELAGAGARVPYLDPVDSRIIDDVRNRRGGMIDDPFEIGGWPTLPSEAPPADTDSDGMPDDWEEDRGLDASADDSSEDPDGDGYTNIEDYINGLVADLGRR
jgi:pectate lyase